MSRSRPAHGRGRSGAEGHTIRVIVLALVAVVLAGAGGVTYVALNRHQSVPAAAVTKPKIEPINVLSTVPVANAANVDSATTLAVKFTGPLSRDSPMPTLSPPVAGSWEERSPTEVVFVPASPLVPSSSETVTVPGGATGVEGTKGQRLADSVTVPFTVAAGSELRLQELLAQLNYLPLTFTASSPTPDPQNFAEPQLGTFNWRYNLPGLAAEWTEGSDNVVDKGAVMEFENANGLGVDGNAGPAVWSALITDVETNKVNPQSYNYVYVSETVPETATVYENGSAAYSTPVNTGVPGAATQTGTFAVFEHVPSTTMTGTNVDGSHYSDPGIPWVSYFNGGDALHGYVRSSYGTPQSNGCVEMPPANAAIVYPLTPLGTLVTVAA